MSANANAMSELKLPVIDFQGFMFGDAEHRLRIAQQMARASEAFGFFYLINHSVPSGVIDDGFGAAHEFFALPDDRRMACKAGTRGQNRGYQPLFDTAREGEAPDLKESFDMGFPLPDDDVDVAGQVPFHGRNSWPDSESIRVRVESLYYAMLTSGRQVLRCLAMALGVDENFFVSRCDKPITNMRLVHYPPQPEQNSAGIDAGIGATPHVDKGLITLLLNDDNGGLHVQLASGEWVDAAPMKGAIVVNIGQLMTRWTNGRFVSAVHRVVNQSGNERYSIPQFHHCNFGALIDPRDLAPEDVPAFDPVIAGEFVAAGFKRDRRSWR